MKKLLVFALVILLSCAFTISTDRIYFNDGYILDVDYTAKNVSVSDTDYFMLGRQVYSVSNSLFYRVETW